MGHAIIAVNGMTCPPVSAGRRRALIIVGSFHLREESRGNAKHSFHQSDYRSQPANSLVKIIVLDEVLHCKVELQQRL